MYPNRKFLILFLLSFLAVLGSGLLTGCSAKEAGGEQAFPMSHLEGAPAEVLNAPAAVRDAYAFAVANPEIVKELPCYCGCGAMGHTSNYACYVSAVDASGNVSYDTHALGCSICVDITLDAMRMLKQGKALPEIRTFVDDTYARYGPSNLP
jgi:hypothetical protein